MFLGHIGLALAAKKIEPKMNLGAAILSAQLVDLVWPLLLLAGIEQADIKPGNLVMNNLVFTHYPWTHSLAMSAVWALAAFSLVWLLYKNKRLAVVSGLLVFSHWWLDLPYHQPDLLLVPGGETQLGFSLWNSPFATYAGEFGILALGLILYFKSRPALTRGKAIAFWSFIFFIVFGYFASIFGPPPPDAMALAWGGVSMWLMIPWAWWADR